MIKENLLNKRFGKLVVISSADNIGKKSAWKCRCDCGKETIVTSTHLKSGHTISCGCYHKSAMRKKMIKANKIIYKNNYAYLYDDMGNYALIDKDDIYKVSKYYWRKGTNGYWHRTYNISKEEGGLYLLHQYILNYQSSLQGKVIDHINRRKYDNRKSNLRIVTQQENSLNRN